MRNPFVACAGGVLSADIAVPEHSRELEFYREVLTTGDNPCWREDLMNNLGEPVIGLGERVPEYESLPLQWMPHFQVADVATSAQLAIEHGGEEIMHGKDENGQSLWAAVSDPFGAAVGLIPVADPPPAGDRRGIISWLSLTVSDTSKAQAFYGSVLGWSSSSVETEHSAETSSDFEMLLEDGTVATEILQCGTERDGGPPVWLMHLPVGDLSESLRQVRDRGGEVICEVSGACAAVVKDPVGVCFALTSARE